MTSGRTLKALREDHAPEAQNVERASGLAHRKASFDLCFRFQEFRFRVSGFRFSVFEIRGSGQQPGFRSSGFRGPGCGFRGMDFGVRISGDEFWISGDFGG